MIYGSGGIGGVQGWRVLQRSSSSQTAQLAKDPVVVREQAAFAACMAKNPTAADLVKNYQGLKVALTAFGLESDLPNKAFLQKVLESDLNDAKSLANRLSDKRYRKLAEAFGFKALVRPSPQAITTRINSLYLDRELERRVGESEPELRIAMNAKRELALLADRKSSEKAKWYEILGNAPLAQMVKAGLGLPDGLSRAPIDQQVTTLSDAAQRRLGISGPSGLSDPATLAKLIDSYVARSSIGKGSTPYSTALSILANR